MNFVFQTSTQFKLREKLFPINEHRSLNFLFNFNFCLTLKIFRNLQFPAPPGYQQPALIRKTPCGGVVKVSNANSISIGRWIYGECQSICFLAKKKPIFPIDDASIPDSISAARHSFQLKSISSNLPAHAGVH